MAGINLKVQIEINGQFVQAGHITGSSFYLQQEAKNCGLGPKVAMKIYDELYNGIQKTLLDSADELSKIGFTEAHAMAEKILGYVKK